jgi:hypothetical protein
MLDVADCGKPVEDIDIGRMRWAREFLDETQRCGKVFFWGGAGALGAGGAGAGGGCGDREARTAR